MNAIKNSPSSDSRPEPRVASPLDVEGLDLDLSADEIVMMVREGRRTEYRLNVDWREYVTDDARLRDSDTTVSEILDDLAAGPGPDEVARNRLGLTCAAVEAAIRYAAELARQ